MGRKHGPMMPGMRMERRLALFDKSRSLVAPQGRAIDIEHFITEPIRIDNTTVGWLGIEKNRKFSDPINISFLTGQTNAIYTTGIGILLVAIVVALLLSRHLTAPIKLIMQGTKEIARRKFDTRIELDTMDELGSLAENFNRMAQTLEKYEEARKQWFTDISHELGTPLTILRGEIESVEDGIRPLNLESLAFEVNRISKIIHELREISLAETGGLVWRPQPIDVGRVLLEIAGIYRSRFSLANIELRVPKPDESPMEIQGNEDKLKQLFSNILDNSLRYTDKPGMLEIAFEKAVSRIRILFQDSGPGVPEDSIPFLFDRLYRVESSRSRIEGGSGLGLAICKYIVELHGGTISAANYCGGLQLKIELPRRKDGDV